MSGGSKAVQGGDGLLRSLVERVRQRRINRWVVGSSPTRGVWRFGEGPFWVYVLENSVGRCYIVSTDDHDSSEKILSKYTHKNGPWKLIWGKRA